MGLEIKGQFEFNSTNDEIPFTDITGTYDATDNPTGYGTPNKSASLAMQTTFRIVKPDGTTVDINLDSTTSPSANFVPKNALERAFTLAQLELDDEEFPDGIYQVHYIIWMKVDDTLPSPTYTISYPLPVGSGRAYAKIVGTDTSFTSVLNGFGDTIIVRVIRASDSTEYEDFSINAIVSNTEMVLEQVPTKFSLTQGDPGSNKLVILRAGYKNLFATYNKNQLMKCFLPKIAGLHVTGTKGCGQPSCASYTEDKKVQDLLELHLGLFTVESQLEYGAWEEANKNAKTLLRVCSNLNCQC